MDQVLGNLPGVYISNRDNYSVGERLSVRGMGWRAAFGVRGVQVLLDGIPLTAPDGQTILEIVDPNTIRSAEIIRGPSAIFWGNGSGGTLFFSTEGTSDDPTVSVRTFAGPWQTLQSDVRVSTAIASTQIRATVSDFRTEGFRDHSRATIQRAGVSVTHTFAPQQQLSYTGLAVVAPDIRNPGSLNATQLSANRTGANPVFITQQAGKSFTHIMQGLRYQTQHGANRYDVVVHGTLRDLDNPIQPTIIRLNRLSGGLRSALQREIAPNLELMVAADVARQSDRRRNWVNTAGNKGAPTVRQQETLQTFGLAAIGTYSMGRLGIQGGIRQNWLFFQVDDQFGGASDASGDRLMRALTPQLGITVDLGVPTWFAGVSTAFESPTTTELANRPDLSRGFNPDLNPERALGFETGIRGYVDPIRLRFEIVAYQIQIDDRLLAYQTEAGGDRNFFENAGESRHRGMEFFTEWTPHTVLRLQASYTYSDLRIRSNEQNLRSKQIPGVPAHRAYLSAAINLQGMQLTADVRHHGEMFTNNVNTVKNQAFTVADVRVSGEIRLKSHDITLTPFAQVRNLTDATYNASVSINAFGGRFFEPAPPRAIFGGVAVQFR